MVWGLSKNPRVGVVMSPLGNSGYSRWRPKLAGKNGILFSSSYGMRYVSIYVFEVADHEFHTRVGLRPMIVAK